MKAQISIEGMITMIIILIVFTILIMATLSTQETSKQMENFFKKRERCLEFSNEINYVFLQGHGTKSRLFLSGQLNVQNNFASIDNVFCALCCNVTKNGQTNFNVTGYVDIENIRGDIIVD